MTSLIARIQAALATRRQYNTTVRELQALSARDLQDLGISRSDIPAIAREAVAA